MGCVFDRMEFHRADQALELSKTEQKLLRLLVENRGQTLSRAALVDRIWTDGAEYVDENALSVAVKRLRDKLEETPSRPKYLNGKRDADVRVMEGMFWFYSYHPTVAPVLLLVPVFILLGCALPLAVYGAVSRLSIVERLREAET